MVNKQRAGAKPGSGGRQAIEDALDKLFAMPAPRKDTGPDPLDICSELPVPSRPAKAAGAQAEGAVELQLDEADRARLNQLLDALFELTGEPADVALALRVALHACPLQVPVLGRVLMELPHPPAQDSHAAAATVAKPAVRGGAAGGRKRKPM